MTILEIACQGSGLLDIDELKPFQGSLKSLSKENYNRLRAEMLADGFSFPIFVWQHEGSNFIIDGHQRLNTLLEMRKEGVKVPKIPVALIGAHTYKQAKKKVLAAASVYGRIEDQGLYEFLQNAAIDIDEIVEKIDLPNFDMDKFKAGYSPEGGGGNTDPDEVPEPPKVAKSKLGQIYKLGEHRLMCGDSTKKEDVERLMGGEKADMVFTDPPYGIAYDNAQRWKGTKKQSANLKINPGPMIIGDDKDFDPSFILSFFDYCKEIFIWGMQYYSDKLTRGGAIVWNRKTKEQEDCPFADFELCWSKQERNRMAWIIWGGFISREKNEERLHTTQKPIALAEWFFEQWGSGRNIIVDLFLGSGSTLIACEKTNRKCYGMEIDPIYCDVIIKRWEEYTGQKAELISG